MTPDKASVALVVPLYNEEALTHILVREIETFRRDRPEIQEILLIDDGSRDDTFRNLVALTDGLDGYVLVRFSRNFGHQLAVTAGLDLVTANAAVIMDADLQDPLEVAGRMIDTWREGYDVVYGIRRERGGMSFTERWTARVFYRVFRRFSGIDAPLDAGDFRLVSRRVMDAWKDLSEQQPYVRGLIAWLGFNQTGIEYDRPARVAGTSKYPMVKRLQLALDGLASFSAQPLRLAVRLGLLVSAGSVFGLLWVLVTKYVLGTAITGWASLIFVGFFFGGVQLFFLGVVGSYVARVYDEVKGRPRYVVQEIRTSRSHGAEQNGNDVVGEDRTGEQGI
ncbi:MAG: glycosyltransferase [Bacteroidetes bacterium CG12_big_fil_rev_8_21_14_0_65_60_17]|nr:MAG: glycosyltransferase [Bacteroidetes bacterium CG12_big_fil_rev_8_21_14_0_65_60_17]